MEPSTSSWFLDQCGNYERGFANLPMEIILKIFRYLTFYDIQASSLTCRRWLEASESNEFQTKVLLKFSKPCLDDRTMPGELIVRTQRRYNTLYLDETVFGSLHGFFKTLSKTVDKLTIISSDITDKQFYGIVKQLPNVTDLTIENCTSLFMAGQFLQTDEASDNMKNWLCNIKKLSLRKNQYLSDAILLRITTLINNIEKLDLCGCHIAYHNAIQRRFYPPHLENTPSESILTFKFVLKVIEKHAPTISELDLSHTLIGGPALSSVSSTAGLKLKKVKFSFCRQLNLVGLNSLTTLHRNITEMNISNSDGVSDECMALITENLVLLEKFYLRKCRKLTSSSAISISSLTKLKVLDISLCDGMSSDGFLGGIATNTNSCLEELYIVAIDVCEECIIQIATNLKKLRVLDIGHCVNGVTNISVDAITNNLRLLRSFDIEGCPLISDGALTGINALSPSSNQRSTFSPPGSSVALYFDGFHIDPIAQAGVNSLLARQERIPPPPPPLLPAQLPRRIRNSPEQGRPPVLPASPSTPSRSIRSNYKLSIYDEPRGIKLLKGLQSLNLQGCKISDISLEYGLQFVELRRIILANCQGLTDNGILHLVNNCPAIEDLDMSDCNINDKAIRHIAKGFKRLRILNISGNPKLTDHSIDALIVNCTYLQCLSVNRCHLIRSDSDFILKNLPTLHNINIDRPSGFEYTDVFRLKKKMDY